MYCIIFALITILPRPTVGMVDCHLACTRCEAQREDHPGILEVYCAMCRECDDRRREQRLREHLEIEQQIFDLDGTSEVTTNTGSLDDCPTPPPCESDLEEVPSTVAQKLRKTTTTTTTTTTTRKPCPPVTGCKKTRTPPPPVCYLPCMPACPCPYPQPSPAPAPHPLAATTTDFIYVYVGVPKDLLKKAEIRNQPDSRRSK